MVDKNIKGIKSIVMEIIIKGGMFDRKRSESEEVFKFNCEDIPFFNNFDPRSINLGNKSNQARDYTYIIRTTEDGFDFGIHFLNIEYGPRRPAVAIFLRAGWMIPNKGDVLVKKLNEMAEKTLTAIGKYVDGRDAGNIQGPFQNPLSDTDLNEIKKECQFCEIEKIAVKDALSDKKIFLTEVSSVEHFFENPYQIGQISSKGAIWSAWNDITSDKLPNDIVKTAANSRNYLYKSLKSRLYSLKLSESEVKMEYFDPIIDRSYIHHGKITGSDNTYLKYEGDRFVYQKTAEEAGIPFKYGIKIDWTIEGAFGNTKKTNCLQASKGILPVDYEDISKPKELTCADGEKKIIEITENDIKKGFMTVRSKAKEAEFIIKVSGSDFEETPITVKVDSASPAYETIKKISYNQRQDINLSKADKEPRDYRRLFKNFLLIFVIVVLVAGVILLVKSLFFQSSETTEKQNIPQSAQVVGQNNSNNIEEDKKYLKKESIWNKAALKSNEAKVLYENVLDWDVDKIKNNPTFGDCAGNPTLNKAVTNYDPTKKDSISKELKKNSNIINLNQLNFYIENNTECN